MAAQSNNSQSNNEVQLLKGALTPTLIVGLIALIAATVLRGQSGLIGALLAQTVVLIYFIVHILISRISRNLDPMSTMALALFSYFAKFLLLGAFLWALTTYTSRDAIDRARRELGHGGLHAVRELVVLDRAFDGLGLGLMRERAVHARDQLPLARLRVERRLVLGDIETQATMLGNQETVGRPLFAVHVQPRSAPVQQLHQRRELLRTILGGSQFFPTDTG